LNVRFLRPAHRELMDAIRYYDAQRVRLGDEFRDEVRQTIQRIKSFPTAWHPLTESIRRCQLNRFPYGLIYIASDVEILILAVSHLHRAPEYWRSRTRGT